MNTLFNKYLGALLFLLVPALAMAGSLNPRGADAWDLYVMGNGAAIFQILTAIKLITSSSGFTTLLLVLATVGFFFLAIQAGFDPGKNLMKMFGFLLTTWMVVMSTHSLKANININDPVTDYYDVVTDVPALVGVPTAIISEVGHWMTKNVETAFSIPGELSMGLGGGYNLATTMMEDAQNFTITNPELKKSLAAYAGDCVIPALARQQISTQDLKVSNDLWTTYQKAASGALFTRYYLADPTKQGTAAPASITCGGEQVQLDTGMGGTLTCNAAYACLGQDLQNHAQELLEAKASQWSKTGTLIPWEQRMQVALETASGGHNQGAAGLTPVGTILQSAMINEMNGSFRQAAVQSGDNEILLAASVSQAEAQQKSAWATGSLIFQNMMGYVYTVLQAFTLALVPIVLIALMIPGLGHQIFVSFGQLLVWMALWEPMLAIVNFLIMVFSKQTLGATWMMDKGGLTLQNRYLVSEQTSNLVTTAQFMGTMVPLMAWGLVKGSMAFTEFIAHGIGNSFASSAGAAAASGNLSMGNMSMGNVSNSKYNTAAQSTVGNQATNVFSNTGAGLNTAEMGGSTATLNGQSASKVQTAQQSLSDNTTRQTTATQGKNAGHSHDSRQAVNQREGYSQGESARNSFNRGDSTSSGQNVSNQRSLNQGHGVSQGSHTSTNAGDTTTKGTGVNMHADMSSKQDFGGGGGAGAGAGALAAGEGGAGAAAAAAEGKKGSKFTAGVGGGASLSMNHQNSWGSSAGTDQAAKSNMDAGHGLSDARTASRQLTDSHGFSTENHTGHDNSGGHERSASHGASWGDSSSLGTSHSHANSYNSSVNRTITMAQSFDIRDLDSYYTQTAFDDAQAFNMAMSMAASEYSTGQGITAASGQVSSAWGATESAIPSGGGLTLGGSGLSGPDTSLFSSVNSGITAGEAQVTKRKQGIEASTSFTQNLMAGNTGTFNPYNLSSTGADGKVHDKWNTVDYTAGAVGATAGITWGAKTFMSNMPGFSAPGKIASKFKK